MASIRWLLGILVVVVLWLLTITVRLVVGHIWGTVSARRRDSLSRAEQSRATQVNGMVVEELLFLNRLLPLLCVGERMKVFSRLPRPCHCSLAPETKANSLPAKAGPLPSSGDPRSKRGHPGRHTQRR